MNEGMSFEPEQKEIVDKERLIVSVNEFVRDRDVDKFIKESERYPEIEVDSIDFEKVKKTVEIPGTITHICRQEDVANPKRLTPHAPLEFWLRKGLGEAISHHHRFPIESSTSVNATAWDGFNSSVDGGNSWSLRDTKGQLHDLNLVVLSQKAVEKAAGENYEPNDSWFFDDIKSYLEAKDSFHSNIFFETLKTIHDIEYVPPKDDGNSPEWINMQIRFALYERLCLMKSLNKSDFNNYYSRFIHEIEEVSRYLREEGKDFGFRYRGVYESDGKKYWGPLETTSEDISRIVIPAKPGESYLSINFKDHIPL